MKKKIRLPRKAKKALSNECGQSEYLTQRYMISIGVLSDFIII